MTSFEDHCKCSMSHQISLGVLIISHNLHDLLSSHNTMLIIQLITIDPSHNKEGNSSIPSLNFTQSLVIIILWPHKISNKLKLFQQYAFDTSVFLILQRLPNNCKLLGISVLMRPHHCFLCIYQYEAHTNQFLRNMRILDANVD